MTPPLPHKSRPVDPPTGFADIFAPRSTRSSVRTSSTQSDDDFEVTEPLMMKHSASTSVLEMGLDHWSQSVNKPITYTIGNSKIRFQKPLVMAISVVLLALVFLLYLALSGQKSRTTNYSLPDDHVHSYSVKKNPAEYNSTYPLSRPTITEKGLQYRIGVIADLDTDSKVPDKSDLWRSYFKQGFLYIDGNKVDFEWDETEPFELKSSLSNGGRGMELSELIVFNGHLYTVDDRTGVVYLLEKGKVVPWVILSDGNGGETKGFKSEWCAIKDKHLYIGGLGKEWTTPDGNVINFNPMYVKRISMDGQVEHINWHDQYIKLRETAGIEFPGYMIHEAAAWSQTHQKWFFMPRRASKKKYNDVEDERHGTNMILSTDENFNKVTLTTVGDLSQPSHGFSSFKFVPGTNDEIVVALKSEELEGTIATYIMAFKVDGTILYPETKIGNHKYEGIEFI